MSITLEESIDELHKSYIDWDRLQVTHIKELHKLLAGARRILVQIHTDQLHVAFETAFKDRGGKSAKNTTLELKVVKVALTTDPKRASAYSRILRVAAKENIEPDSIPKWIEDKGGIEAIRLENTNAQDSDAKFTNNKMSLFARKILLENFTVPDLEAQKNDIVILIGRAGEDNTIDVFEIAISGDDDALVKAAVAAVIKKHDDASETKEIDHDGDDLIDQLAASASASAPATSTEGGAANA